MKDLIIGYLKDAGRPVKRRELLQYLRAAGQDITDRAMRREVEMLITRDGELIQSSERGYHLINSEEDLMEAMEYLTHKAEAIAIRKNCLLRNYRNLFKKEPVCQSVLF